MFYFDYFFFVGKYFSIWVSLLLSKHSSFESDRYFELRCDIQTKFCGRMVFGNV
jgi:hypothetical protein